MTSLYERRKSRRGPSGRRCPPRWSRWWSPSLAQPGRDERRRQGTLSRRPHLPGRAVRRHRRGLCPAVLDGTAADRGDPAHLPWRDVPSTAAPGARPQFDRRHGRPPASSRAAPPQAESIPWPARRASRRRVEFGTRRCWNLLFLRRWQEQRCSFPWWRAGRRIFHFCSAAGPAVPTVSRKSNFLFLRVLRSMGRQCATPCFLTLAHDPFCQ